MRIEQVGDLSPGTSFVTLVTRREGVLMDIDDAHDGVKVRFFDGKEKFLHPDVKVQVTGGY